MKVKYVKKADGFVNPGLTLGKIYNAKINSSGNYDLEDNKNEITTVFDYEVEVIEEEPQKDKHYNNENGSLYLFAQHHDLNTWEFDILKRVVRCRKKGQFKEDLEKTKRVIDLYLKEFEA